MTPSTSLTTIHPKLKQLLYHSGSNTHRLHQLFKIQPGVTKLAASTKPIFAFENRLLVSANTTAYAFVREICMSVQQRVVMFGRTVIPLTALQGRLKKIKLIGDQSIGPWLYRYHHLLSRKTLSILPLATQHPLYPLAHQALAADPPSTLWHKCSIMQLQQHTLLIHEVFNDAAFYDLD